MSHYPSYSKSSFKKYEANQTYLSKKRTDRDSDNSKNKYDIVVSTETKTTGTIKTNSTQKVQEENTRNLIRSIQMTTKK